MELVSRSIMFSPCTTHHLDAIPVSSAEPHMNAQVNTYSPSLVALSLSSLSCKHGYPKYISLWLFRHSLCLGVGLQLMFQHPSGNHADQSLSCLQKKNASDKQQIQEWGQEAFGAKRLCLEMAGRGEHGAGPPDNTAWVNDSCRGVGRQSQLIPTPCGAVGHVLHSAASLPCLPPQRGVSFCPGSVSSSLSRKGLVNDPSLLSVTETLNQDIIRSSGLVMGLLSPMTPGGWLILK